jgi:hypothetical protein
MVAAITYQSLNSHSSTGEIFHSIVVCVRASCGLYGPLEDFSEGGDEVAGKSPLSMPMAKPSS